jgi:hemolysin III
MTQNARMKTKPLLRGHFHQAMFFIALGACIPLIVRCNTTPERLSIIVYSLCVLTMFGISTLYHRVTWNLELRLLWKKLDHAGIYLMIAGSFTPVAVLGLDPQASTKLLITIWSVAFIGILQSIFFVNVPKYVSSILYVIAGYLILPYLSELKNTIGTTNIWLIVAEGIAYSLGAISYGLKRPVFNPQVFSYHEVFHLFVNLGATLHFIVVSSLIR